MTDPLIWLKIFNRMLQFNKSQATNTNAVWPDNELTASYTGDLVVDFSQSYDNSFTPAGGTIINNPGVNGQEYIVFQVTGSDVPSPSGQYNVNIYTGTIYDAIWGQVNTKWEAMSSKWSSNKGYNRDTLLTTERAYVSGSNESQITQYVSPNENGTYTTYNG